MGSLLDPNAIPSDPKTGKPLNQSLLKAWQKAAPPMAVAATMATAPAVAAPQEVAQHFASEKPAIVMTQATPQQTIPNPVRQSDVARQPAMDPAVRAQKVNEGLERHQKLQNAADAVARGQVGQEYVLGKIGKENPAALKFYQQGGFTNLQEFANYSGELARNPEIGDMKGAFANNPQLGRQMVDQWRADVRASGQDPAARGYNAQGTTTIVDRIATGIQDGKLPQLAAAQDISGINTALSSSGATVQTPPTQAAPSQGGGAQIGRTSLDTWQAEQEAAGNHVDMLVARNGQPSIYTAVDPQGKMQAAAKVGAGGDVTTANRAFLEQASMGRMEMLDNPGGGFQKARTLGGAMDFAEKQFQKNAPSAPTMGIPQQPGMGL